MQQLRSGSSVAYSGLTFVELCESALGKTDHDLDWAFEADHDDTDLEPTSDSAGSDCAGDPGGADSAVADPELIQLFEFMISNGVGKNTYVEEFLDWAGASINPNKRQVRVAAFGPINKMCEGPRSKMATAK